MFSSVPLPKAVLCLYILAFSVCFLSLQWNLDPVVTTQMDISLPGACVVTDPCWSSVALLLCIALFSWNRGHVLHIFISPCMTAFYWLVMVYLCFKSENFFIIYLILHSKGTFRIRILEVKSSWLASLFWLISKKTWCDSCTPFLFPSHSVSFF